jgi:beta-glucosidase
MTNDKFLNFPRFGIVYVDYETLGRTIKDSGRWYAGVIENDGFDPNSH